MKEASVIYTAAYREAVRQNTTHHPWARELRDAAVLRAAYFMGLSDEELWALMPSPTLPRSYTVWTDGVCPDCRESIPMKGWIVDAKAAPWKVRCSHCGALFPKNDFAAYLQSGLDEWGIFRCERADDTLLGPEGRESVYRPGVDDGFGAISGWCTQKRWYFIAHYAAAGQWKQLVVEGAQSLAAAYVMTGDAAYAHKAGVILDRVADLLPWFDYHRQGLVYECPGDMGYVTTWHDSNFELRTLLLAYDMVAGAMDKDEGLLSFLREKSHTVRTALPKESFADLRANIETRFLRDILKNPRKVTLNYPGTEVLLLLCKLLLGNREGALGDAEAVFRTATAVDGVTGERGIGGYAGFTADTALLLLELLSLADPALPPEILARHPALEQTFRFFTDIHLLGRYYPNVGDTTYFAGPQPLFSGLHPTRRIGGEAAPGFNLYTLLYKLYRLTGNEYYLNTLRQTAAQWDFACDAGDPDADAVSAAAAQAPAEGSQKSLNLQNWQLAVLRAGQGENARALWIHYLPWKERHGHVDTMNFGLLACGLDLLPDCGYPPVQYGGWFTDRVAWYRGIWSHNAVVVDRLNQSGPRDSRGVTKLWADSDGVRAVTVAADGLYGTERYERTLCLLDLDEAHSLVFDIFRVIGGTEHIKPLHAAYGTLFADFPRPETLEFEKSLLFRDVRGGPWEDAATAEWRIEDRYGLLPEPKDVRLRLWEFTEGRELYAGEMWINAGPNSVCREEYIPVLMTRRQGTAPLSSEFETVLLPYSGENPVRDVERLSKFRYRVTTAAGKAVTVQFSFPEDGDYALTVQRDR